MSTFAADAIVLLEILGVPISLAFCSIGLVEKMNNQQ